VTLATARVATVLAAGPADGQPYDVVFADPPYATPAQEVDAVLDALAGRGWLVPGATVVIERGTRSPALTWVPKITAERSRRYGDTLLWYGRHS
jgi:16S rRNA (guanine966-N2)-methyltransferase